MQCLSEREHDLGGQETLCQVWEGFRRSKDVAHRFGYVWLICTVQGRHVLN